MPLKFIHTADNHLGAPLRTFGAYASKRTEDFQRTFSKTIDYSIEKQVQLLLIAGDLFDDIEIDRALVGWVTEELRRYSHHDGNIVIIPGTHDHTESGNWALKSLNNVYLLDSPVITSPLKITIGNENIHLYGFSFRHGQTPENWRPMMTRRDAEGFHIGMLHGAYKRNKDWNIPQKDLPFSLLDLKELNLDYVALGHYHGSQILDYEGKTLASYPGSPEGKSFSETGERFIHLVTINEPGGRTEVEQIPIQTKKLLDQTLDVGDCANEDVITQRISKDCEPNTLARITLTGIAEFPIESEKIIEKLSTSFPHIEIRNETTLIESSLIDKLKDELTIRGAFVRRALSSLENAKTVEERNKIRRAMNEVLLEFQRSS